VEFEFDPKKSSANKAKHGIDFVEAPALWLDEALIEAPMTSRASSSSAASTAGIGRRSAVCVRRGERTRIISVRRSRREEIEAYEGA
jgi:uncharacterized DUF497 family protein